MKTSLNIHEKKLQEMTIKHKEYSDLNNYKKKCCSYKKLELLFNINKALFLSFRVVIIIIIFAVTVSIICFFKENYKPSIVHILLSKINLPKLLFYLINMLLCFHPVSFCNIFDGFVH